MLLCEHSISIFTKNGKPRIQRVQEFADISRSVLCCHSNETRAPIADPPNSVQLEDHLPFASYIRVRAVVWECGEGQTDRQIHASCEI